MARTFRIQGSPIDFPPVCVVCGAPASSHTYGVERTFFYVRRVIPFTVSVPMCAAHYALSTAKSGPQRWVERLGFAAGILIWILIAGGLVYYWTSTHQAVTIFTVFLAAFLGFGFFLMAWIAIAAWIAPIFSSPQTKTARSRVRLKRYWPRDDTLELEISSERIADGFVLANQDRLVGLRAYCLSASLLCHDERLNTQIAREIRLDHAPGKDEAMRLLWPVGEAEVSRNYCQGCPFELLAITIQEK